MRPGCNLVVACRSSLVPGLPCLRHARTVSQLDADFAVLAGRIGRARQEPLGVDRDWREYYLLGGPAEGQQPTAELGVLWVRARAARASSACPAETWRGVSSPEQLQADLVH